MIEKRLELGTQEGTVEGGLFLPDGEGPWPLVVFYHDAGGLRPALATMAERLTKAGYAVVQPNLFWRAGPFAPFDMGAVFSDPEERKRLMELLHAVSTEKAMSDTRHLVEEAAADDRIRAETFGCLGYCMGGRMAFLAAAEFPSRVVAAASIHGGGLVSEEDDSPHLRADRIGAVLYLGVADEDRSCTADHQTTLRRALDEAGVRYTLELYAGARHGFAIGDLPVYDPDAAERHWERVLALFDAELRPTAL